MSLTYIGHGSRNEDWPEMSVRVEEAQRRIGEGLGLRRIPAHWGDVDLVLGDLARENAALRKRVEELERDNVAAQVTVGAFEDIKARAEKAERELQRIEAKRIERQKKHARCDFKRRERMRQLQANLDAATFFADSLQARLDLHEAHDSACPCSGDGELHSYSCRDCTCGIGEEFREVLTRAEQAERERDDAKQYAEEYKKAYLSELDGIKLHMDKLQADLDAALDWIAEGWSNAKPESWARTLALLEKRRADTLRSLRGPGEVGA